MKRLLIVASCLAIAACGEAAAPVEEEAAVEEVAAEVAEAPAAVDGGPLAGSYNTVDADGQSAVWTLAEDGTFTLAAEGVDPVSGTYTNTTGEDGDTFCADPEGDEAGETCWAISTPAEDGSWTATAEDGSVLTVNRADAAAE